MVLKKILSIVLVVAFIVSGLIGCTKKETSSNEIEEKEVQAQVVDTQIVKDALKKEEWVVVDTRLNDAFNGWKLDGVKRGGRIKGAQDFSANWLKVDKKDKEKILEEALNLKGITKEKDVILYDANGKDAKAVAKYLNTKGYNNLYLYDVKKWAADESLPMEKYKNYQLIVPAVIVKDILDGNKPETFENAKEIVIAEASWGKEKNSYKKGHIPTAFHIDTDIIEPPIEVNDGKDGMMWMLADDKALAKFALDFGFKRDQTVICTSEEPLAAYRLYTVLKYLGVKDVRVLNGGTMAWTMAGYELETKSHKPVAVKEFGAKMPVNPDVFDTMDETRANLKNPEKCVLLDNRTLDEHLGKSSGYTYHHKKGRIPGSVFGYAGKTDSYAMDYFRNIDRTMRNAKEFTKLWTDQGIDLNKHLAFYCGSGWRVAEIYAFADVYGLEDIAVFSDGWIGWSNDPTNSIETGEDKNLKEVVK